VLIYDCDRKKQWAHQYPMDKFLDVFIFCFSDDLKKVFKECSTKYVITIPELLPKVTPAIQDLHNSIKVNFGFFNLHQA
jgi:hypothetical protein